MIEEAIIVIKVYMRIEKQSKIVRCLPVKHSLENTFSFPSIMMRWKMKMMLKHCKTQKANNFFFFGVFLFNWIIQLSLSFSFILFINLIYFIFWGIENQNWHLLIPLLIIFRSIRGRIFMINYIIFMWKCGITSTKHAKNRWKFNYPLKSWTCYLI